MSLSMPPQVVIGDSHSLGFYPEIWQRLSNPYPVRYLYECGMILFIIVILAEYTCRLGFRFLLITFTLTHKLNTTDAICCQHFAAAHTQD